MAGTFCTLVDSSCLQYVYLPLHFACSACAGTSTLVVARISCCRWSLDNSCKPTRNHLQSCKENVVARECSCELFLDMRRKNRA
eukprot:573169-Pleurochrysis_carterae.AAC.1